MWCPITWNHWFLLKCLLSRLLSSSSAKGKVCWIKFIVLYFRQIFPQSMCLVRIHNSSCPTCLHDMSWNISFFPCAGFVNTTSSVGRGSTVCFRGWFHVCSFSVQSFVLPFNLYVQNLPGSIKLLWYDYNSPIVLQGKYNTCHNATSMYFLWW